MVNKEPGDAESIDAYLDLLFSLAEQLPTLSERKEFVGQANIALSFYEENANLTPEVIEKISEYRIRLNSVAAKIDEADAKIVAAEVSETEAENEKQIKRLYDIKQSLTNAKTQSEFNKALNEISAVDAKIDHDALTEGQTVHYDQLNRECTDAISAKMRELEHISNVAYNKKAVDAFEAAFKKFKSDENKYKAKTQLFSLVSSTLFAYDAGKLFNETLIYYNHVYSYIFSKLDDDGKLALTKYSIECERKLR
jgi:hypothetical protein